MVDTMSLSLAQFSKAGPYDAPASVTIAKKKVQSPWQHIPAAFVVSACGYAVMSQALFPSLVIMLKIIQQD